MRCRDVDLIIGKPWHRLIIISIDLPLILMIVIIISIKIRIHRKRAAFGTAGVLWVERLPQRGRRGTDIGFCEPHIPQFGYKSLPSLTQAAKWPGKRRTLLYGIKYLLFALLNARQFGQ